MLVDFHSLGFFFASFFILSHEETVPKGGKNSSRCDRTPCLWKRGSMSSLSVFMAWGWGFWIQRSEDFQATKTWDILGFTWIYQIFTTKHLDWARQSWENMDFPGFVRKSTGHHGFLFPNIGFYYVSGQVIMNHCVLKLKLYGSEIWVWFPLLTIIPVTSRSELVIVIVICPGRIHVKGKIYRKIWVRKILHPRTPWFHSWGIQPTRVSSTPVMKPKGLSCEISGMPLKANFQGKHTDKQWSTRSVDFRFVGLYAFGTSHTKV